MTVTCRHVAPRIQGPSSQVENSDAASLHSSVSEGCQGIALDYVISSLIKRVSIPIDTLRKWNHTRCVPHTEKALLQFKVDPKRPCCKSGVS